MIIYLDFDGTVVEHEFPSIGKANPNALEVIKKLQDKGYNIILNTMRVEFCDETMQEALDYINRNPSVAGIVIDGQTANKIHPHRWDLTNIGEEIFIDDIAADIPLIRASKGMMVDWAEIEKQLIDCGLL